VNYYPGWLLVLVGTVITTIGLVWMFAPSIPWLGRLPGDIVIERADNRFYYPVMTCILVSLLLNWVMSLIRHFVK
jgi:hypothetical protein